MSLETVINAIPGVGLLALPFVSQIDSLNWHFSWKSNSKPAGGAAPIATSQREIFNTLAAIFGASLYSFIMFQAPVRWLFEYSALCWFGLFAISVAGYYALFLGFREATENGQKVYILPLALLTYLLVFASLALLMGLVISLKDYYVFAGHVRSANQPQGGMKVDAGANDLDLSINNDTTDKSGYFCIGIPKANYTTEVAKDFKITINVQGTGVQNMEPQPFPLASKTNLTLEVTKK